MRHLSQSLVAALALLTLSVGAIAFGSSHDSPSVPPTSPADGFAAAAGGCILQTFGAHQYRTCNIGHPAETALAADPSGPVWALSASRPQKSTDAGLNWVGVALTPPNVAVGVVPEGDVIVAPNGDILLTWLTPTIVHTAPVWVSTNGGATFTYKPLTGPSPVPDRPWIMTTATSPIDASNLLQPNPYAAVVEGGLGAKPHYVSGDRGTTWRLKTQPLLQAQLSSQPDPVPTANPYLNFAKPFGQGFQSQYVLFGDGQVLYLPTKQLTYDFANWATFPSAATWPLVSGFPWWDTSGDGTIYAVQIVPVGGTWTVKYKWYDGTWHDGASTATLTAQPDYLIGLTPQHVVNAAVKAFGSTLGINTREGTNDVLIRIANANTASPTVTKERIGPGSGARYDYPNLVFDAQGRAVTTYNGSNVAYATAT